MPAPPKTWDLQLLNYLLAGEGMARGPEVWLHIHKLLAIRASQGAAPETPAQFAALLGPLVCKNPRQQQRLPLLLAEWLNSETPKVAATLHAGAAETPGGEKPEILGQALHRFKRRYIAGVALLLAILLMLAALALLHLPQPPINLPEETEKPVTPAGPELILKGEPITDWAPPNLAPPPAPPLPAYLGYLPAVAAWSLPALALLVWLVWHYRSRLFLRKAAREPDAGQIFTGLRIKQRQDSGAALFGGPEIDAASQRLLHPQYIPSRRLHVADSVNATASRYGFFQPVYRRRHIKPEYYLLVQGLHGKDQLAALAGMLIGRLLEGKADIRAYRFRDDPRRLLPWLPDGIGDDALSLEQLRRQSDHARLIVIGDWDILFEPYRPERPQAWSRLLEDWPRRAWLSPGYGAAEWAERAARQARQLNIRLYPLSAETIPELAFYLSQDDLPPAPAGRTADDYLPTMLGNTAESWLHWRPPRSADPKRLLLELRGYLGADGLLLLQALAVFPKPLWPLPLLLDLQLFRTAPAAPAKKWRWPRRKARPGDSPAADAGGAQSRRRREQRLLLLSRLPWLRQAHLPDYMRELLLKALNRSDRREIRRHWRAVLEKVAGGDRNQPVEVPIALPEKAKLHLNTFLHGQPKDSLLHDAIFANILLGGKLGLLDFQLPRYLSSLFPGADRWLDPRPALLALLLAIGAGWGMQAGMQAAGEPALRAAWQAVLDRDNPDWLVEIDYRADTRQLADNLGRRLEAADFRIRQRTPASPPAANKVHGVFVPGVFESPAAANSIHYPPGQRAIAERVAEKLVWLSYGSAVALSESNTIQPRTLQVQIGRTYQANAEFSDELRNPATAAELGQTGVLPKEPEMVIIKPGQFMMGSAGKEQGRHEAEGPQHLVSISQPFAIGKYEVTFAEYDLFAAATGRKKPDDSGWGRGDRPAIHVSFDDAQAYARWLSQQTGKYYRLPSEAEWEYAARAGTQTAYWWGDSIGKNRANCDGCGSQWDNKQTAPVGSFKANAFGLFDTAGNVWEWTEDCWHGYYENAPGDGSAWLAEAGGDCGRRVVRGGSWGGNPRVLRSAFRGRIDTVVAYVNLGFRVARAL